MLNYKAVKRQGTVAVKVLTAPQTNDHWGTDSLNIFIGMVNCINFSKSADGLA